MIQQAVEQHRTFLYDKGANLSGGERQRLQMARTLFADAEVLIIDDAISQVDAVGKNRILEFVTQDASRNMVILTSQRPSILEKCNKIIVFQGGEILDCGTPQSLLITCDLYRTLYDGQGGDV